MTNNGNMEKSRSHGLIYLTFPFLHQYITAALNQFIQSIISKYEYFKQYIFTIIIPIYINHNHQVYTNPAIINYHVNKTQL